MARARPNVRSMVVVGALYLERNNQELSFFSRIRSEMVIFFPLWMPTEHHLGRMVEGLDAAKRTKGDLLECQGVLPLRKLLARRLKTGTRGKTGSFSRSAIE